MSHRKSFISERLLTQKRLWKLALHITVCVTRDWHCWTERNKILHFGNRCLFEPEKLYENQYTSITGWKDLIDSPKFHPESMAMLSRTSPNVALNLAVAPSRALPAETRIARTLRCLAGNSGAQLGIRNGTRARMWQWHWQFWLNILGSRRVSLFARKTFLCTRSFLSPTSIRRTVSVLVVAAKVFPPRMHTIDY